MKARSLLAILAVICASNASLAQTPATGAQPVAAAPSAAQYLSVLDATFYLNKYPDLKAAFGTNLDAAKTHWLQYGIKEGRDSAAGFSIGGYMARYPELQKTLGIDYAAYLGHWFSNGIKEKRDPSATGTFMGDPRAAPLDPIFYARKYPELMAAFGFNVPGLVNHWLQYGINEKRQPNATAPAPAGVPGAPTIGTATPGNATASVTFTAPASNGGSAITGYTVTSIPGGLTVTGAASPLTVTGLTNGTAYIFNATARNAVGTSPASAASNIATPAVPVAAQAALTLPIGYQAVRLDTQANFTADLPVGTQFIIQSGVGYWSVRLGAAGAWSQPALVTNLANATLFTSCFVGAFNTSDYAYTRPAGYTGTFVQVMPCTGPSTAPTGGMIFDANAAPQYLSIGDWNNRGMNRVFTFTADNAVGDDWGNWLGDMFQPKVTFANAMRTRMIKPPAAAPGAPTTVTASPANAQATVSFIAPASNGGSALSYTVTSSPGGLIAKGAASPLTVTGLTNGTAYTFTVTTSNAAGTSAASAASSSVTPVGAPGAPTIGTATPGNATASVGFSAPVSNGGSAITGYTVTSNPAGGVDANAKTTGLTHSITGLTNGTAYTFTVTASSAAGTSAASVASNSATPATVPTAPTIGTVMQGTTAAIVTFTAPVSNGGSAITGYTVTSNPAGGVDFNANTTDLTHNITGLTKGTAYTFTVKAVNAIGTSAASAAPNSAPPGGVPGVPYMRGATLADTTAATATVSFTAPDNNGGSAITGYTVKSSPGGLTATGAASPLTVTGLTYGTTYTFTVTASNAAGTSAASVESNSATPATVLTIPAGYQAIRLDTQANFTADLPAGTQFIILSRSDDVPGVAIWYWKFSLGGPGPELVSNPAEATLFTNCLVSGFNTSDSTSTRPAGYTGTFVQVMPCTGPSGAPTGGMIFVGTGAPAYAGFANWNTAGKFRVFTFTANSAVGDNSGNWLGKGFVGKVPFANAMPTRMIKPTPAAPGAPTTVTASAGNAQATLSFDAPANTGGIAIKGYTVTSSPGALTATGAASPLTVTGLTNGTAYTFTITASNAVGTSAASAASNSATPVDPKIAAAAKIAADAAKAAADKATAAVKVATDALVAAKTATDSCAVLVNKVTSSPAPAGFAASVTDDLSNSILAVQYRAAHPAKIAGGKPDDIDSKLLKPIPADHLAYIVKLKAASAEMETGCQAAAAYKGDALVKQVLADVKAAKFDAPGDTAANNKSRADAVAKGLTDYLVSSTALADAMTKLSTDRMHQAYTGTWVKQFLERN